MHRTTILDGTYREPFQRNGFVQVPLFGRAECDALMEVYRANDPGLTQGFYTTLWSPDIGYRRRAEEGIRAVLAPRLQTYFGDRAKLVLVQFAVKRGGQPETSVCPLHQDWSFVDESKYEAVSIWCPLLGTTVDNGPLAVVPGSHRVLDTPRCNYAKEHNFQQLEPLFPTLRDRYLRELYVPAGECLLYDGGIVHGSRPNSSQEDRVAVVAVVIPASSTLKHYWRISRDQIEVFNVEEEFFTSQVAVGVRPQGHANELLHCPLPEHPPTEDEFLQRSQNADREPVGSAATVVA